MNLHSPTTQNDILSILQHEQEHALSLLSLSPLLSSLLISYAGRAGARGFTSSGSSADSEEWKALQDTIRLLREENDELKREAREMVRKMEMSEASQESLRSHVSSLDEANAAHQEDIKSLRVELVEIKEKYDRVATDSEAEKTTLKAQISDLEVSLELFDRHRRLQAV
jgi:FtsZ-binding cell division protein ZapB